MAIRQKVPRGDEQDSLELVAQEDYIALHDWFVNHPKGRLYDQEAVCWTLLGRGSFSWTVREMAKWNRQILGL